MELYSTYTHLFGRLIPSSLLKRLAESQVLWGLAVILMSLDPIMIMLLVAVRELCAFHCLLCKLFLASRLNTCSFALWGWEGQKRVYLFWMTDKSICKLQLSTQPQCNEKKCQSCCARIHLFIIYLLRVFYMPVTMLGTEVQGWGWIRYRPGSHGLCVLVGRTVTRYLQCSGTPAELGWALSHIWAWTGCWLVSADLGWGLLCSTFFWVPHTLSNRLVWVGS